VGHADVRNKSDRRLRHRRYHLGPDGAVGAMGRDPEPTSHHHSLPDGDDGLRVGGQATIQPVLLLEELVTGLVETGGVVLSYGTDVAPRAERPLAAGTDEHLLDSGVVQPTIHGLSDPRDHLLIEGVQRLRTVELDDSRPAFD